jgi:phosphatidylinositol alpha-1,6-mannosyltransferase
MPQSHQDPGYYRVGKKREVTWKQPAMFNLLMVCTDFPPDRGGISTYSNELASALVKSCRVTVLAPGTPDRIAFDESCNFRIIRTPALPFIRIAALMIYLPYLLMRFRFDAVLHTVWPTALISHLYYGFWPVAYFISVHASEILDDKRTWRRRLKYHLRFWRNAAINRAAGIFPVSQYGATALQSFGLTQKNIHVVPNGVDPQRFKPDMRSNDRSRTKRILTVARLDLHKGHDRVLEALRSIKSKGLVFEYIIVGEGDEERRLRQISKELGLANEVLFAGHIPDRELPGVYASADIFVMASREIPGRLDLIEGFGIAFLEAAACGLPVIAGRSGGVADAVRNGKTGFLVDPEDPKEIADALHLLLTDSDLCRRLGGAGRQWTLCEMNWKNTAKRLLDKMQRPDRESRTHFTAGAHVRNLRNN